MRYNEEQLQAAEYIIKYIKDGGSCVDKDDMMRDLYERYDYSDLPNIVLDFLEEDGVIAYRGRYVKLTNKGSNVAVHGAEESIKRERFWEKTVQIKTVMEIAGACVVIGSALTKVIEWLFDLLF